MGGLIVLLILVSVVLWAVCWVLAHAGLVLVALTAAGLVAWHHRRAGG